MTIAAPDAAAKNMPSGANAPYKIMPAGKKFVVKNNAGETKATFDTRSAAADYVQALYANVPGAKKRAQKVKFTGKAKNRTPNEKAELGEAATLECVDPDCARSFLDELAFQTHVGIVHPEIMAEVIDDEARQFTAADRKQAAKKGQAMPGGGFPIKSAEDLMNAIKALGRAKDKAVAKAHIIKRAKALGLTKNLPNGWTTDGASVDCPDCSRIFLDAAAFVDHAEAVHTFDDIRMIVSEAIGEKYANRDGDFTNRIYTYVADLADDWVVFEASKGNESDTYKCSYSIVDNVATLGQIAEVRRRTVWEPVGANEPAGVLSTQEGN